MNTRSSGLLTVLLAFVAFPVASHARALRRDDRVAAQRAIGRVYWKHRIWPKENSGPKPPLSAVISDAAIRTKVEDYLGKSNALDSIWNRPITPGQFQAEMNRMAANTRDPRVLRELFEALGNDPLLIAETLARQTLADRLIRSAYASDSRFHGSLRAKAEAALAKCTEIGCLKSLAGEYRETVWKLEAGRPDRRLEDHATRLGAEEWQGHLVRLAGMLGGEPESLPVHRMSGLQESSEAFFVLAVASQREDEVVTASALWPKAPFDAWWKEWRRASRDGGRAGTGVLADVAPEAFTLPAVPETGCTDDTWAPIFVDAPDPRSLHAAVWTGTEMIIWGGQSVNGARLNSGGRYNPATDTWTFTSTGANVPAGRSAPTAVWTGTEMIVWGGSFSSFSTTNTGGRYDPSTDSWTPTSTGANVPSGRTTHSAVWTGTEMIIWGGRSGTTALSTGGRYIPSSNTWAATSTGANVPSARSNHTAVWTGTEMIVWGGIDADFYVIPLNSGGRYNPAGDTWAATSTDANLPAGRWYHTAVWSESEMIAWGGQGNANTFNSGGRYDPATDAWTPTSTGANVPSPRRQHSAVWTGTEMIVTGGDNPITATGGRYCACSSPLTYYRDADGDGLGDPAITTEACVGTAPAGYVANQTDRSDADALVWTSPQEGANLTITASSPADPAWDSQAAGSGPGTVYDLVSGNLGPGPGSNFAGAACLQSGGGNSYSDLRPDPGMGNADWYVARARNSCGTGTYGSATRDASIPACP
jgi:hypothetical protein